MIEIIIEDIKMPKLSERRYKRILIGTQWTVIDTLNDSKRYTGSFENSSLACHNLNKKYYRDNLT